MVKTNTRVLIASLAAAALLVAPAGYAADTKSTTANVKEAVSDTSITAKVKTAFAKDKDVSAMNIKVDTDNKGAVTLSGNAKSKAEADKAVRIAKDTQGVASVKNNIKIEAK